MRSRGDFGEPGDVPCPEHVPTGPSWDTVCMLKDSSWPGSRSSSLRLEKALAIILLFLILLGWSSLCPVSLEGTEGTGGTAVTADPAQLPLPFWMGHQAGSLGDGDVPRTHPNIPEHSTAH